MSPLHRPHPTQLLHTPGGTPVPIDRDLVPLIRRLWERGIRTKASCQDYGESLTDSGPGMPSSDPRWADFHTGRVWLKMRPDHAERLITLLGANRELSFAMRQWGTADSWLCVRPVTPDLSGGPARTGDVHVFFPQKHLDRVVEVFSGLP